MRTSGILALILSASLMACSGTDGSALSKSDEAFLQSVYDQTVRAPQTLLESDQVDASVKDLVKDVEQSSNTLAAESRMVWDEVNQTVRGNETAMALIDQASEAIDQSDAKAEARAWIEAVIKQRESLINAAQTQIDTTTNEEVKQLAEKVKAEQSVLVERLREELEQLSK